MLLVETMPSQRGAFESAKFVFHQLTSLNSLLLLLMCQILAVDMAEGFNNNKTIDSDDVLLCV